MANGARCAFTRARSSNLRFQITAYPPLLEEITPENKHTEEDWKHAARLVDQAVTGLFFSSGAHGSGSTEPRLSTVESKKLFLREYSSVQELTGRAAVPHALYYQIKLYDFLSPGDPGTVFDMLAALCSERAGQRGFYHEQMAVDACIKMLNRYLADHRHIFSEKPARRTMLADLLRRFSVFPEALDLVYRLPELLR